MGAEHDTTGFVVPRSTIRTLLLTRHEIRAIAVDERSGARHKLDPAAASVWALLDRPTRPAELASELSETFGIESNMAIDAVDAALHEFRRLGLLADGQDSGGAPRPREARALPREHDP